MVQTYLLRHLRSSCPWTLSSFSLSCSGCSCLKIFHCSCIVKMILKWSWNVCYFMKLLWILYYYLLFYIILILNGCESHCSKNNKVTFGDESTAGWSDRHWFRSASSCFSCFLPFVYWFISIFWVYTFFITGNSMSIILLACVLVRYLRMKVLLLISLYNLMNVCATNTCCCCFLFIFWGWCTNVYG
jgi:hypothetical protein